ncbi:DUF3618 domain-containing protein [Actinokineospora globicatena]|uniref:DUF3618 domain-containing protein n=1 Tax=Actinokineospora globicatena TaxID=103729 RepID=UPI0020A5F18C|nr:DUF3618 domain-containing protein [Actinokineospora globicatena]MCP2303713.1 Protein of unknown function (DUF3618) [Actinokineospora globicatena]GLW79143.1 hypothetical protein Aglo01_36250 [Actinokineospora globicatena]GLW86447.1 hypothetical protein Aglo02_40860 [Actinokineospora globicatena]
MSTDPEQLRKEIEGTQRVLSADVDALAEKVTPSRVVHRKVSRLRRSVSGVRDTVMGAPSPKPGPSRGQAHQAASGVTDAVSAGASAAVQAVQEAPDAIRRNTAGNPLAVGLIAFGAGWLVASLAPASEPEQKAAEKVKDQVAGPMGEHLGAAAQQAGEALREPAQEAVESVRSSAADAAQAVTDEAKSASQDVKSTAKS